MQQVENIKGDALLVQMYDIKDDYKEVSTSYTNVRIFKNTPEIRYTGKIHERLVKPGHFKLVDCSDILTVFHLGYNKKLRQKKDKDSRNLTLLKKQLTDEPENGNIHFYLSDQYLALGNWDKTIEHGKMALKYGINLLGREAKAYVNIIQATMRKNAPSEEVGTLIREALSKFPDYPDLYILQSDYYRSLGLFKDEADSLEVGLRLYERGNNNYVSKYSPSLLKNIFNRLGFLYYIMNDLHGCVHYRSRALQVDKYDTEAFQQLLKVLLKKENVNNVTSFLSHHYQSEQELVFVTKNAIILNAIEVFNYFYALLPVYIRSDFEVYYHYFNKQYNEALSACIYNYKQT
ncbi:MAG: hypothetical protein H0Z24_10340, partial [Thermosipho sp. (in: Bacteria)]|nr:hypothetical protein [Thermosipho sp. (in: thermotogales)]